MGVVLNRKQAGVELCQAQVKLKVIVIVEVEVKACHYWLGGWVDLNEINAKLNTS